MLLAEMPVSLVLMSVFRLKNSIPVWFMFFEFSFIEQPVEIGHPNAVSTEIATLELAYVII